jgi:hypothetical protein
MRDGAAAHFIPELAKMALQDRREIDFAAAFA